MAEVLIICGELSGDLYASRLALALTAQGKRVVGIGGPKLKKVADEFLYEVASEHAIGPVEYFKKFFFIREFKRFFNHLINTRSFSQSIIIDFQHLNVFLGHRLASKDIPIYTFITPNFWMWQDLKNAKKLIRYSTHIYTIFPQEYRFYKTLTPHVSFFGHPLTSIVSSETAKTHPSIDEKELAIGLMPGSRSQEFELYFSKMLESIVHLLVDFPRITLAIRVSNPVFEARIKHDVARFTKLPNIEYYSNDDDLFFQKSHIIITATGSATIETLLHYRPMIVLAALSPITYFVATRFLGVNLKYIALPNVIAQKRIVTELVQDNITADHIQLAVKHIVGHYDPLILETQFNSVISQLKQDHVFEAIAGHIDQNSSS